MYFIRARLYLRPDVFGVDPHKVNVDVVVNSGMHERFNDGFVRVANLNVLADHGDANPVGGIAHPPHHLRPLGKIGLGHG